MLIAIVSPLLWQDTTPFTQGDTSNNKTAKPVEEYSFFKRYSFKPIKYKIIRHELTNIENTETPKEELLKQQYNNEAIQIMRTEFKAMHLLQGDLNKHAIRNEKLSQMAQDPEMIKIAKHIFEDLDWVFEQFGKDQAITRVYSIELLKKHAEIKESLDELELVTQRLASNMASEKRIWRNGREYDLRDLIGAIIKIGGRKEILHDAKSFLQRTGYKTELKRIYGLAVASYLYNSSNDEEVDRAFMPFWDRLDI